MRRASIPRCMVLGAPTRLDPIARAFARFGVTELVVRHPVDIDPRPLQVRVIGAGPAGVDRIGHVPDRLLVCDGMDFDQADIGALLADAATDPEDVSVRVLVHSSDGDGPGVAVVRRDAVTGATTFAEIIANAAERGTLRQTVATRIPAGENGRRPALFLDRDGTLNVDHGYVGAQDRFEWIAGAREAVRHATALGWHVFVVTNQSGVARGHYDEDAVCQLHDWMTDEIRRAGGTIDDVRYCPFHPDATEPRYRALSDWRKPGPGMIRDLIRAWELDPAACLMVGDQPSDVAAAAAAGIAGHSFTGGRLDDRIAPLLREHLATHAAMAEAN